MVSIRKLFGAGPREDLIRYPYYDKLKIGTLVSFEIRNRISVESSKLAITLTSFTGGVWSRSMELGGDHGTSFRSAWNKAGT
jgi:hypothetical protein